MTDEQSAHDRKMDEVENIIKTVTLELMNETMDDFLQADNWDIPAAVGAITISSQMRGLIPILDRDDELWEVGPTGHPIEGLVAATMRLSQHPIAPATDPEGNRAMIMGVLMLNEGYSVTEPTREGLEHWQTHRIKDDPRGVEVLLCTAVTVDGCYSLTQPRGGERGELLEGAEGRVIDALSAMFHVIAGQQLGRGV